MQIAYIVAALILFICAVKWFHFSCDDEIIEEGKQSFYDPKDTDNFLF
jgi:hypothetical protein